MAAINCYLPSGKRYKAFHTWVVHRGCVFNATATRPGWTITPPEACPAIAGSSGIRRGCLSIQAAHHPELMQHVGAGLFTPPPRRKMWSATFSAIGTRS